MIRINNIDYKIRKKPDEIHSDIRHLTIVVNGYIPACYHEKEFTITHLDRFGDSEEIRGIILMPHFNEHKNTSMFLVYVED